MTRDRNGDASALDRLGFRPIPMTIAVTIGLVLWFVPPPDDVSQNAWRMLALFAATIAAIIGKAMVIGALSIVAIALVAVTRLTSPTPGEAIGDALSSFSNPLIWLIGVAIMISRGLIKSGLGARIGYYFISLWGRRTIGIAYALALLELVLAPVTPSNTARGGAIVHPIMRAIAGSYDSDPDKGTEKRMGTYLALTNYHANPITSAMFVTATAPNPLVVQLIADVTGADIQLSWGTWALAMVLPGLVALGIMPLVIYMLAPPEIKSTPNSAVFARARLKELGPLQRDESIMLAVFAVLLVLWAGVPAMIFGASAEVNPTTTAFIGLSLLLLTGVLTWDDVISEKAAWDTIVWFGALVMMATFLNSLGLIAWLSDTLEAGIASLGLNWFWGSALLALAYLYAHYAFASTTAHITAMFAAFYAAGLALGAPALPYALVLAAFSSLMMTLTHYATGTSPVIFGSGYTSLGLWWKVGFVMSVVTMGVWVVVGSLWWWVLGYWSW